MFSMKNYEENNLESKSNPSKTQFIENIIHNVIELLIIFHGLTRFPEIKKNPKLFIDSVSLIKIVINDHTIKRTHYENIYKLVNTHY